MLNCIIGTAVSGDELFGRKKELDNIWSSIDDGSILLISPRRFGKTSITFDMRDFPRDNFKVYYLDVESLETPGDLVVEIIDKTDNLKNIPTKFKDVFTSLIKNIEEIGILETKIKLRDYFKDDWQNKGNKVFEKISEEDFTAIFVIDELPSMLQNIIKLNNNGAKIAKLFLNWLRQIRSSYNIRFVICGSIGIDQILRQCNAVETVNDLKRIVLQPLSDSVARDMIIQLFKGFRIDIQQTMLNSIIEHMGVGIPFFIKIFVQAIVNEARDSNSAPTIEIIKNAYEKRVLGVEGKGYFEHYFTRINTYYDGAKETAKNILNHLAVNDGVKLKELFQTFSTSSKSNSREEFTDLMERLQDDFYIFYDGDQKLYYFYTKILKDLWCKKMGL